MLTTPAPTDGDQLRATDLRTKRDTLAVFVRQRSAQIFGLWAVALVAVRLVVGGFGHGDVVVLLVTLAIAGVVEWIIHLFLLHAPEDAWTSRVLGTGAGHREHHLDPPHLGWLLLGGVDATVFVNVFALVTAGWVLPAMWLVDGAWLGPFLTAWALAAAGLTHYEWTHLLVHTRYRPRSRYYSRLERNHRLHHFRNERYWLGVTSNLGDRVLRTYPKRKTDVPLSPTARTLGAEPET
ncbi:MAG: sterol desaturase family protein [Actinomycetota bacterium]